MPGEGGSVRIRWLQHVPFEGPANIATWAEARGHEIEGVRLYDDEPLPYVDEFDWLVVMGGTMGAGDERAHPWLADEKEAIGDAMGAGKLVLGVCLGAQLMAEVLGSRVYRDAEPEIGWFPVRRTAAGRTARVLGSLPESFQAFHWHGDTFELPRGTVHAAESEACAHQAFEASGGRIVGLQFHVESTPESVCELTEHCEEELVDAPWVQTRDEILAPERPYAELKRTLWAVLDAMADEAALGI